MGASGVKLFDDDLAADVRDLFRELLGYGKTGTEATAMLIDHYQEVVGTEEEPVFWLAVAASQWEYGLLQADVLERVNRIVADGSDLVRWADDSKLQRQRQKALEELCRRLNTPQSRPKKIRKKRLPPKCEWEQGEVIAYHVQSGQILLLRVIAVTRNHLHETPFCELLDWVGTSLPSVEQISQLEIRRNKRYPSESVFRFPMMKKYLSCCRSLNLRLPPTMKYPCGYEPPLNFDTLSSDLEDVFGMSLEQHDPASGDETNST